MFRNLRKLFTQITLSVLAALSLFGQTESAIKNVFWQPNELQPGSVTFLTVELNRDATKVSGQFLSKHLLFFHSGKARVWYSLAGLDVETTPGTYDLRIRATLSGGRVARTVKPVEIGTVTFRAGDVNVPENFVKPDEASQRKIAADQKLKRRAFAHFIPTTQWSGDFIKPVEAPPTEFWTRKVNEWREQERRLESELSGLKLQIAADGMVTVKRIFELANKAHFLYFTRDHAERGQLLKSVLLNCDTDGVSLWPVYRKPLDLIFKRAKTQEWSGREDLNLRPLVPKQPRKHYLIDSLSLVLRLRPRF